jgi:lysophospholipase L1-like esterase
VRLIAALAALLVLAPPVPPAAAEPVSYPEDLPHVITVGTSIEAGTGHLPGESWPERLAQRAPGYEFTDMSLSGGAYTGDSATGDNIRKHVDAAIAEQPDVIILGGPVNDLVRLSDVGPLRQAVFDAANAAQSAGIRVVVMAILPFNDGGAFAAGWWPTLEPRRTAFNDWCQAMYGPACVDLTWALHETTTWRGDNRWFRDGLHFTRVGADLAAEAFPLDRLGSS